MKHQFPKTLYVKRVEDEGYLITAEYLKDLADSLNEEEIPVGVYELVKRTTIRVVVEEV